jgi:hypothetical protein
MKRQYIAFILILLFSVVSLKGQSGQQKLNPVGTWKFEAPAAPEGYNSGKITVGLAEKKPTATISFTGSEYKIPGDKVKVTNDSLLFSVYLESETVNMYLRMTPDNKMTGKAVYSQGEVPLSLIKEAAAAK